MEGLKDERFYEREHVVEGFRLCLFGELELLEEVGLAREFVDGVRGVEEFELARLNGVGFEFRDEDFVSQVGFVRAYEVLRAVTSEFVAYDADDGLECECEEVWVEGKERGSEEVGESHGGNLASAQVTQLVNAVDAEDADELVDEFVAIVGSREGTSARVSAASRGRRRGRVMRMRTASSAAAATSDVLLTLLLLLMMFADELLCW